MVVCWKYCVDGVKEFGCAGAMKLGVLQPEGVCRLVRFRTGAVVCESGRRVRV